MTDALAPLGSDALDVERAAAYLARCRDVDEVRDVRDKAKAIECYQRSRGASKSAQRDAAELVVRSEVRLGELLRETTKAAAGRPPANRSEETTDYRGAPTLADRGIDKRDASRWQRASEVDEDVREQVFAASRASGRPVMTATLAEIARIAPEHRDAVLARADLSRPGNVRALAKQATARAVGDRLNAERPPPITGPFRVIVADPAWRYTEADEDASNRAVTPYPTMTNDEICALQIGDRYVTDLACDDSVLCLWCPNAFVVDGVHKLVLDAWGFRGKTLLTWDKGVLGLGKTLRNRTEQCVIATRGNPTITLTNESTLLSAPRREHSRKPDQFYELVERVMPGSKLELFAREARPGWSAWGAETERFAPDAQPRLVGT